jgi:hypothetical protein
MKSVIGKVIFVVLILFGCSRVVEDHFDDWQPVSHWSESDENEKDSVSSRDGGLNYGNEGIDYSYRGGSQLEIEELNVPFKSQSPPGDWSHNMNCGPTSVLMIAGYYLGWQPSTNDLKELLDWMYAYHYIYPQSVGEYYDGNVTNMTELGNVLEDHYNLGSVVKKNVNDLSYLHEQLLNNRPVIVAVNIQMQPHKMGHFMVLVGMTEDEVIVHDPGKTLGQNNVYSKSQFVSSWQTSNYASLVLETPGVSWHLNGSLVQLIGSPEVYLVKNGQLFWITDMQVFNAHHFKANQIIPITANEFDCYEYGGEIDWQPYRELFRVGDQYYLFEKQSFDSTGGVYYWFLNAFAFNSWGVPGPVVELGWSEAEQLYFGKYLDGGALFVRHGTVVKPGFQVTEFPSVEYFVADDMGLYWPLASKEVFQQMGYDKLPLYLAATVEDFYGSVQAFGEVIDESYLQICHDDKEQDDGLDPQGGSGADEEDIPDEPDDQPPAQFQISCTISCPDGFQAFVWYANAQQLTGSLVELKITEDELCYRGEPWFDFNCACTEPDLWSCFDPAEAEISCNQNFTVHVPGIVDSVGEGEVWFDEMSCQ